jgi:hypothetical protein
VHSWIVRMVESDGRMVKRFTRTANVDVEVKTDE